MEIRFYKILNTKYQLKTMFIVLILFAFCNKTSFSQVQDTIIPQDQNTEQIIENISEANDGAEIDYSELVEYLAYYLENPFNLNTAKPEDLKRVLSLSDYQVYQLKAYIDSKGELVSLYELNAIDGFDKALIFRILPYITVKPSANPYQISLKDVFKYGRNDVFVRFQQNLEEAAGYAEASDSLLKANPNARYLGSPQKLYAKYAFNYHNKIRFGITAEKDAGEQFFAGNQKNGFDFYSAHFFLQDFGIVKDLAIGDYHLQFGQGLALWTGMGSSKSGNSTDLKKKPAGIKPFASADENNFMRGIATTIGFKKYSLSVFYSSNKKDANLGDTLNAEESYISSIQETGYHRTAGEIADKDILKEQIYGAHFDYKTEHFKVGVTFVQSIYDIDLQKKLSAYSQFQFVGTHNQNISVDYNWLIKGASIFGEAARSDNGAFAMVNGVSLRPDPLVGIALVHRYYEKDFQGIRSAAFGENSSNTNEQALYLGANIILNSKLTIDGYSDVFSFPWLKYRVDAPSNGTEYMVQLNYTPTRSTQMYFRFRQTNKSINNTEELLLNRVIENQKQSMRFHVSYKLIGNLSLKNRVEVTSYKTEKTATNIGYLIYQDVSYLFNKIPLTISGRYALFNTDSYDERLYAYESDVLYAYSIPAYYYRGTRVYCLLKYSPNRKIDFWFRIAQTWYADQNVISSGLEQINGNTKTEIKAQIRVKF